MKDTTPKISVIMPVYNNESYVREAIESILAQSYEEFEFIIIDDCSCDSTFDILNSYKDKRIRLYRNSRNLGNYKARNIGFSLSLGKYICVMDSDDIASRERLRKQFQFMEKNTNICICGGAIRLIKSRKIFIPPTTHDKIKVHLLSNIYPKHPTLFFRSEELRFHSLKYNDNLRYAADYDFLVKAVRVVSIACIDDIILNYRIHPKQISCNKNCEQARIANNIRINQLSYLGISPTKSEKLLHLKLMRKQKPSDKNEYERMLNWANFMINKNNRHRYFDPLILSTHLRNLIKQMLNSQIKILSISE